MAHISDNPANDVSERVKTCRISAVYHPRCPTDVLTDVGQKTFNTCSGVSFPFCTQIPFFPLYCCSLFFITIVSTYRSPPAWAHLAHVSARQDAAATRRIIHCQRCYDFVRLYLFFLALLLVIAPLAFPSHFVTLYKVKRSMKTLLICKWATVKDTDSPLSETPPLCIRC